MSYNPEIHHRRSIRLKGHDYAGGGVYFVTICAHREFVEWADGKPFGASGRGAAVVPPGRMAPIREIMEEEMQKTARLLPWMEWGERVIMPDHFHALIRVERGGGRLGDVITGFKAGVTRTVRARGDILVARNGTHAPENMRIWHRNYYEMIVRTPEAEQTIAEYIRMNPWRCVTDFGAGLRGMGNPGLWTAKKLGVLCSRNAPQGVDNNAILADHLVALSGFHSPVEREIFENLLECKRPVIWCPAWGLDWAASQPAVREALEENRLLILEMRNHDGDLAAAEQRNRFVLERADELWLPHVAPNGMLDRLIRELRVEEKVKARAPATRGVKEPAQTSSQKSK
ncbi:transposase [Pontiella sp.]|uniref:transposase n=1 Tax=Pontiella sp. TaxID=2837462 RepID=UPI003563B971